MRDEAARLTRELAEERERVEAWRSASGLVGIHSNGCEGDPGDVEPHHLERHLNEQEERVERLRAEGRRLVRDYQRTGRISSARVGLFVRLLNAADE